VKDLPLYYVPSVPAKHLTKQRKLLSSPDMCRVFFIPVAGHFSYAVLHQHFALRLKHLENEKPPVVARVPEGDSCDFG